jgi:hypothetical protein
MADEPAAAAVPKSQIETAAVDPGCKHGPSAAFFKSFPKPSGFWGKIHAEL